MTYSEIDLDGTWQELAFEFILGHGRHYKTLWSLPQRL